MAQQIAEVRTEENCNLVRIESETLFPIRGTTILTEEEAKVLRNELSEKLDE